MKEEEIRIPNLNDTIITRLRLSTNNINEDDGWYISYIEASDINVGVDESSHGLSNSSVYPNPARDFINVTLPENKIIQSINISGLLGNVVNNDIYSFNLNNQELRITWNTLPVGSYLIEIFTENGKKQYARFFVGY